MKKSRSKDKTQSQTSNTVIHLLRNNGTVIDNFTTDINDINHYDNIIFDYAQILLLGNHANDSQDGNMFLISKYDLKTVLAYKWYLNASGYPGTYGTVDGQHNFARPIPLHQFVYTLMNGFIPQGYVVDHINRNRLDNRRDNLRLCTPLQNSYNKSKPKNSTKRYKGVTKCGKKNPTYTASITKDGIKHEIKNIQTEEEAARIYDIMAEDLFGEYAAKNFFDNVK